MPNPPSTGLPNPASYDTSAGNVVVDQVTGLTWRLFTGVTSSLADDEAFCASSGFRLPSLLELMTIVDPTRLYPSSSTSAFPGLASTFDTSDHDWYRTSTWAKEWTTQYGSLGYHQAMWYVNFGTGTAEYWGVDSGGTGLGGKVLCVEGAMSGAGGPDCQYVASNGTVLDTNTGLTWQQAVSSTTYSQSDATAYCQSNTPGLPGSGWRLPSYNELMSLVDVAAALPAIDATFFPSVPLTGESAPFFTSSVSPGSVYGGDTGPWIVDFGVGGSYVAATANATALVRCVR